MAEINLQQQADALYQEAKKKLKQQKKIKRFKQVIIGLCALALFAGKDEPGKSYNLTILGLCVTTAAFVSIDYKRKKEQIEHNLLVELKTDELKQINLETKNEDQLTQDYQLLSSIRQGYKERSIEGFMGLASLAILGTGLFTDKLSWPTACFSMALIMTASSYWEKGNYKSINQSLKYNLQKKIQLQSLEKERE